MEEEIGWKNEERETNGIVDEDGGLDGRGRLGRGIRAFKAASKNFILSCKYHNKKTFKNPGNTARRSTYVMLKTFEKIYIS